MTRLRLVLGLVPLVALGVACGLDLAGAGDFFPPGSDGGPRLDGGDTDTNSPPPRDAQVVDVGGDADADAPDPLVLCASGCAEAGVGTCDDAGTCRIVTEESEAVFYFPGCGSERLFGQVGLATQAMLYDIGSICVLPPGYLCCGYPQTSAGDADAGQKIVTDNRVLFHRVANTLNYLDIRTVIVSCGTCMDQLADYEFGKIFPGCRLLDIHEYLLEKNVKLQNVQGIRYMYHDPCHTPMKTQAPLKIVNELVGGGKANAVKLAERCCGESGTLAISRPDVSTQVRYRKEEMLQKEVAAVRKGNDDEVRLLTSCPSCLQGLSRFEPDTGVKADYIVVEMARHLLGPDWMKDYVEKVNRGGVERVLF